MCKRCCFLISIGMVKNVFILQRLRIFYQFREMLCFLECHVIFRHYLCPFLIGLCSKDLIHHLDLCLHAARVFHRFSCHEARIICHIRAFQHVCRNVCPLFVIGSSCQVEPVAILTFVSIGSGVVRFKSGSRPCLAAVCGKETGA